MFYTEDQLVKFYEIKKRLSQETSKTLHAKNYIQDVNFLVLIIDSLEKTIDSLEKTIDSLEKTIDSLEKEVSSLNEEIFCLL